MKENPEQFLFKKSNKKSPLKAVSEMAEGDLMLIPINQIVPNPAQPREHFDPDKLASLRQTIKNDGLIQPISVQKDDDGYTLIAGERRWLACKSLGRKDIPAVVFGKDTNIDILALVENVQREELTPLEISHSLLLLKEKHKLSPTRLGAIIGLSRNRINELLVLNRIPKPALREVSHLQESTDILTQIATCKSEEAMILFAKRIKESGAKTTKEVRKLKQEYKSGEPKKRGKMIHHFQHEGMDYRLTLDFDSNPIDNARLISTLEDVIQNIKNHDPETNTSSAKRT